MTGPYHIGTSSMICKANQWTGVYITGTSVMKELNGLTLIHENDILTF